MQISIEFFPPSTPIGREKLVASANELQQLLKPRYFSITYGAGGGTREGTYETVKAIKGQGYMAIPHMSCIGSTKEELKEQLVRFRDLGIRYILALRGDLPSGDRSVGDFHYASDFIGFIRKEFGRQFEICVAAYPEKHPQASSLIDDIENLVYKFRQGATMAITQYFFNVDAFLHLRDTLNKCGINTDKTPLIPGVMPITHLQHLIDFSKQCGADIPRWLKHSLEDLRYKPDMMEAFAAQTVAQMLQRLKREGVNEVHIYSLNQVKPVVSLMKRFKMLELC